MWRLNYGTKPQDSATVGGIYIAIYPRVPKRAMFFFSSKMPLCSLIMFDTKTRGFYMPICRKPWLRGARRCRHLTAKTGKRDRSVNSPRTYAPTHAETFPDLDAKIYLYLRTIAGVAVDMYGRRPVVPHLCRRQFIYREISQWPWDCHFCWWSTVPGTYYCPIHSSSREAYWYIVSKTKDDPASEYERTHYKQVSTSIVRVHNEFVLV